MSRALCTVDAGRLPVLDPRGAEDRARRFAAPAASTRRAAPTRSRQTRRSRSTSGASRPPCCRALAKGYERFLAKNAASLTAEYYLPAAVQEFVDAWRGARPRAARAAGRWAGLTHPGDRPRLVQTLLSLTERGDYPATSGRERSLAGRGARGARALRRARPPGRRSSPSRKGPDQPLLGRRRSSRPAASGATCCSRSTATCSTGPRTWSRTCCGSRATSASDSRATAKATRRARCRRWSTTREGRPSWLDAAGETWRLVPWIEGTRALDSATSEAEALEAARAFGRFERAARRPAARPALHATIPGFHDTPARLAAFERMRARGPERPRGRRRATRSRRCSTAGRSPRRSPARRSAARSASARSTTTPRSPTCSSTPRAARRSASWTSTPRCRASRRTTSATSCARP